MKKQRHFFPVISRASLYVVIICLTLLPQLLSGKNFTNPSNKAYASAGVEASAGDFALNVTAQTVESTVCSNATGAAISYSVVGGPEIPDQYAIEADAAAKNAGFADVSWTALPGSPLTYALPANAKAGTYNFIFRIRKSDCAECTAADPFTITVKSPDYNLACVGQANVNLQTDCQATLDWRDVLLGSFTCLNEEEYTLVIKDGYMGNGPVVDGCGKYEYVVTGPNKFTCWGYILAEDKLAPVISYCPPTVSGITKNYGYQEFVCSDLDKLILSGTVTYTSDRNGNINYNAIPAAAKKILDITGYAKFTDNCGDLTITVKDEVVYGYNKDCDDVKIVRRFQAKDACKGLLSEVCYQEIIIAKPELDDVHCPADVELSCEKDFKVDAKGNPHPDVSGYPWLYTAFDHTDDGKDNYEQSLKAAYCNLGASYTDGARIEVCAGTYKVVRTWQILDWCTKEIYECKQVIKVGDNKAPVVKCEETDYDYDGYADLRTYSTGPYDCTAAFLVPMPKVTDNCSEWQVLTEIIGYSANGPVVATILPGKPRYVAGIPLGCHYIKYTVTDACGNKDVIYCPFLVEDQVAPVAVCDDDLHVSIGGQGLARVYAKDIDEGSSDNCGPIRIEVRRRILKGKDYGCLEMFDYNKNGKVIDDEVNLSTQAGSNQKYYYTPWLDYVDFTCCDMNENVRVELRVWDDRNGDGYPGNKVDKAFCGEYKTKNITDNFNVCWLDLLIEDKLPAYCVPPAPAAIDCDKLPYDFDPLNSGQMTKLFGTASGSDNCPGFEVKELAPITDGLNDCGYGKLVRRFQVADGKGLTSTNKCEQIVTVREQHYYKIKFPKDASANCGIPQVDTVEVKELACDLLAVSVKDDKFSASGDECYKIFRTYRVINWCEYDGISEPVTVSRDEDCDGKPGDEDVWVIVKTVKETDPCADYYGEPAAPYYSHVWYDRDANPFNLIPEAGTKGKNCEYETNPFGFWKEVAPITENEEKDTDKYPKGYYGNHCDDMASTGFWQYTQVIKVYDNVKPVVSFPALDPFCSYSSDLAKNCPAPVTINFTIDENCTPKDLSVKLYLDAYRDGVADGEITNLLTGTYPNYTIKGDFPIGKHDIKVAVKDGCGNQAGITIPFEVVDCKAPSPICINGLAVELMPVIPVVDVDGDGDKDKGATAVWASDFIASPSIDCTGPVTYSINRVGETVKKDQTGITLTCDDDASLLVEIWAWDARGNGDFCETYVLVQDNNNVCSASANGSVAGLIVTEEDNTVQNVGVEMSGGAFQTMKTKVDGHYIFTGLNTGFDYTITPHLDALPMNGVSTFDLVLMSKHILGIKVLDTPYKLVAADVNNDKKVSTLDVIALRKMILNIDSNFKNNTSWRFIPADYKFPQPSNPWKEVFPEVINLNNVQGAVTGKDFIGVKVGDIDLNAKVNLLAAETRGARGLFKLQMNEQELLPGETYRIDLKAGQLDAIQGLQFTLQLDRKQVELVDIEYGIAQAGNLGLHLAEEGLITASWNKNGEAQETFKAEDQLFTLVIRSLAKSNLSEVIGLSNRLTEAEAYDLQDETMDLGIDFQTGEVITAAFELLQNVPNPFRETTTIRFYLPESAEGTVSIHDAAGRVVRTIRGSFTQGRNQVTVQRSDVAATGVLYYTLTAGEHTATRKMILVD
jgi:hypothetical protein